jgi:hypothetical protein
MAASYTTPADVTHGEGNGGAEAPLATTNP